MSDSYDPTFDEEFLHEVYEFSQQRFNGVVLEEIWAAEPVELEDLYTRMEAEYELETEEVSSAVLGLSQGKLIAFDPVYDEESDVVERYLETQSLGAYAAMADSQEHYVELVEEADRKSQDL